MYERSQLCLGFPLQWVEKTYHVVSIAYVVLLTMMCPSCDLLISLCL